MGKIWKNPLADEKYKPSEGRRAHPDPVSAPNPTEAREDFSHPTLALSLSRLRFHQCEATKPHVRLSTESPPRPAAANECKANPPSQDIQKPLEIQKAPRSNSNFHAPHVRLWSSSSSNPTQHGAVLGGPRRIGRSEWAINLCSSRIDTTHPPKGLMLLLRRIERSSCCLGAFCFPFGCTF